MILEPDAIPYDDLTGDLFREDPAQKIIPFLGAGASISAKPPAPDAAGGGPGQDPRIREALDRLSRPGSEYPNDDTTARVTLDDATRLYVEIALEMAFLLQRLRETPAAGDAANLLDRLRDDVYPPSAGELVDWLTQSVAYRSFEDVLARVSTRLNRTLDDQYKRALLKLLRSIAGLAGVAPAPLASVSAYFEAVRHRNTLLDRLGEILSNKSQPTPAHQLVAQAAKWHVAPGRSRKGRPPVASGSGHYLILTTNYDCLMEHALEVPFVVLSLGLKDSLVRARFGNMPDPVLAALAEANPPRKPRQFHLEPPKPGVAAVGANGAPLRLAMIYKVHGCIIDWTAHSKDSIVISDNDYVTNISRFSDNDGVIPACVSAILSAPERPYFLFMGYSLRDWNVRGMLRAVRTKRAGVGNEDEDYGDYSVVRNFGPLDEAFFLQHKIRIIHEDLTRFSSALREISDGRYVA